MSDSLKPAAAYYRVSSQRQNLESQQHAVKHAARAHGYEIGETTTYQEKMTGRRLERPELRRLREDARAGRLPRRLYVFRYDRLLRSGIRDMFNLLDELRGFGVEVVSATEGIQLSGPVGDLVMAGFAFAAQMEAVAGDERREASREQRKAKGLPFGCPPKVTREMLDRIAQMREEKRSWRKIAMALKAPFSTLQQAYERDRRARNEENRRP